MKKKKINPRCKCCKERFIAKYPFQKFCLKDECVRAFVEFTKAKEWTKKKKELKKELETVQDLMKIAQKVFNKYIRLRDEGKPCISCGCSFEAKFTNTMLDLVEEPRSKKMDAGHFWSSGGHKSVTFNENNVHGQCVNCNQYKHGNLLEYSKNLKQLLGEEEYNKLEIEAHKERKYTREELRELIKYYKQKIKDESK